MVVAGTGAVDLRKWVGTWTARLARPRLEVFHVRLRRAGLLAAAISFARTPQGQRLIAQARQKLDTPENRAKVQEAVAGLRQSGRRRQA